MAFVHTGEMRGNPLGSSVSQRGSTSTNRGWRRSAKPIRRWQKTCSWARPLRRQAQRPRRQGERDRVTSRRTSDGNCTPPMSRPLAELFALRAKDVLTGAANTDRPRRRFRGPTERPDGSSRTAARYARGCPRKRQGLRGLHGAPISIVTVWPENSRLDLARRTLRCERWLTGALDDVAELQLELS